MEESQERVQMMSEEDMYIAIYNRELQRKVEAKVDIEFYEWKKSNLKNGQRLTHVTQNKIITENNLQASQRRMAIIKKQLDELHVQQKQSA